jgi:ribose-phosphate pyrophosphokinase
MIEVYVNGLKFDYTHFNFPGGEQQVRVQLLLDARPRKVEFVWNYENDAEYLKLALLNDAVQQQYPKVERTLFVSYLPYARQDRVCSPGEANSFAVMCSLINQLKFVAVICDDPHNEKLAHESIDNLVVWKQAACLEAIFYDNWPNSAPAPTWLVFPDAGAQKKRPEYERHSLFDECNFATGSKLRDPLTGALSGFDVDVLDFEGADVMIVDDICDGGGTFLGLGAVLKSRNCGKMSLYTTHGIYSKGKEALEAMFDGGVFCYNDMSKKG